MKNWIIILMAATMGITSGCAKSKSAATDDRDSTISVTKGNVLIVYLSRTKNTKAVAQMIHANVGGTLVELELQDPYPENYAATVAQVQRENETGFLPPLKTTIDSIGKYDTIFIGFPTWGMQLPPPMKSFLRLYNLQGKTIIPFNTNAGYGLGSCVTTVKKLAPNSTILKEFSVQGGIERDGVLFVMTGEKEVQVQQQVKSWLKEIGF